MKIAIPELSVVVLIGPSGSGKSTFARRHFKATEILSSDFCRSLVSDDEVDQSATTDAFEVLQFIAAKRLAAGRMVVVDATNVQPESRKPIVELARRYHCIPVAIVLPVPEAVCQQRNRARPDRDFGEHVIRQQSQQLRRSLRGLEKEGFRHVHVLKEQEDIDRAVIQRQPLWNNLKHEHGPFDIIGDVHGCFAELKELLESLGYRVSSAPESDGFIVSHPDSRRAIFLGDLVDRGPGVTEVLRLVMSMVGSGSGLCVPGNHDVKLMRKLRGKDVRITHGLAESLEQLERETKAFREEVAGFIDGLVSHYVLDDGKLVVAHAGMREDLQGRGSAKVRDFALYGETTGETDDYGLPIRYNWAAEYRGPATVVYGHTPVLDPEWLNRTINVDTGCVFGGKLTALRYPERDMVSVPAKQVYYESAKPFLPNDGASASDMDVDGTARSHEAGGREVLRIEDVLGKRLITARLQNVTIREENSIAALEVMSRFAADPRWLIYLPPTMSPSETSTVDGYLEYPTEAFDYYRRGGVARVIVEEKHMGSRAVMIVCRDEAVALRRFGISGESGICYTRTGRRFFDDRRLEDELLHRIRAAMDSAGLWETLQTDWICLDSELMPWSVKAQELVRQQYASVGAAARAGLAQAISALQQAAERGNSDSGTKTGVDGLDLGSLRDRFAGKLAMAGEYTSAYQNYCWPVDSVDDLKIAPFHILATEGHVHSDKDHTWHLETAARLCRGDEGILIATANRIIDTTDPESIKEGAEWWEELTGRGGEGMVIKPLDFISRGPRGLLQPAMKCRGRQYLRIIYGMEYTDPENLKRLRQRALGGKRSLALREFALGIESLDRFVRGEPLYRVHECVFGVLALESEPVDPRL